MACFRLSASNPLAGMVDAGLPSSSASPGVEGRMDAMERRTLLRGFAATSLASPAVAQPARTATLRFVPQANLTALDPVWTSAIVTQMHGYHVCDTLYAVDGQLRPRPQMAE